MAPVLAIWIGFAVVGGLVVAFAFIADKKRKESLQELASELGLEYRASLDSQDQMDFDRCRLASKGRAKRTSNVIIADSGELRMVLFDYRFTTGSGKNSSTHRQSVVFTRSKTLQLPEFSLGPEGFFHKLGDLFGMKDIDFDDDPNFSNQFLLHGSDPDSVRAFFDSERRKALMKLHGTSIEGEKDFFVFYQRRRRTKAEELRASMDRALEIYQLLS